MQARVVVQSDESDDMNFIASAIPYQVDPLIIAMAVLSYQLTMEIIVVPQSIRHIRLPHAPAWTSHIFSAFPRRS